VCKNYLSIAYLFAITVFAQKNTHYQTNFDLLATLDSIFINIRKESRKIQKCALFGAYFFPEQWSHNLSLDASEPDSIFTLIT